MISSNHAADYYEKLIWSDRMDYVTPDMVPLSDNFYGWAKASYELLGFAFATGNDSDGKPLEMVQLRIGGRAILISIGSLLATKKSCTAGLVLT